MNQFDKPFSSINKTQKEQPNWEKCRAFIRAEVRRFEHAVNEFTQKNPDWIGALDFNDTFGLSTKFELRLGIKLDARPKRKKFEIMDYGKGYNIAVCQMNEEEIQQGAEFLASLIKNRNLKVYRNWKEVGCLDYEIKIKDYTPFRQREPEMMNNENK